MPESTLPLSTLPADARRAMVPQAVVWTGLLAVLAGAVVHGLWRELPLGRFGESAALAGLFALTAWPLRRWRSWPWAQALAVVWVAALVLLGGVLPALSVGLLVAVALGIGSVILSPQRPLPALLAGLAVIAGVVGWLLPLPGHHLASYLALCILIVALRRRAVLAAAGTMQASWRSSVAASPRAAAWAVTVAGMASAGAWLPTMQHDDLAYHLGLPWQLMEHGRYALDPTHQVWALAPWAGDVLQGIAQVIAHAEARGALNGVWLAAALAALWRVTERLGAPAWLCWACTALYASVPLTSGLMGGMQTETPAVAVSLGIALMALEDGADGRRRWWAGACLFGLLCALKPLHGLAAAPLLLWLWWRLRRCLRPLDLASALGVILVLGGSSYTYAAVIAGNPVLPLFNNVFASPYLEARAFDDPRWHAGLGADVLWRLTFDTARYHEGWAGAAGLLYVALGGAWLLALWQPRTRALAACATFAIVVPLLPLQYARYLQPGLALLLPCLALALHRALPARACGAVVVALCVAQLAFQANAQWFLHTGGIKRSLAALGRDAPLFERYAPERVLAQRLAARPSPSPVLLLDAKAPYLAEFAGRGRTTDWYDPALHGQAAAAARDSSGAGWIALLRHSGVRDVIVRPATLTPAQSAALQALGAQRMAEAGEAQWWNLPQEAR